MEKVISRVTAQIGEIALVVDHVGYGSKAVEHLASGRSSRCLIYSAGWDCHQRY
jgi:hypothetical protein